jgi:hypothetical protein
MLTINSRKFAKNDAEFAESLFVAGGTCVGFYKRTAKGVYLYTMQRELIGFMKSDSRFTGLVTAFKTDSGRTRYMFSACSTLEKLVGFDTLRYSQQDAAVREALTC